MRLLEFDAMLLDRLTNQLQIGTASQQSLGLLGVAEEVSARLLALDDDGRGRAASPSSAVGLLIPNRVLVPRRIDSISADGAADLRGHGQTAAIAQKRHGKLLQPAMGEGFHGGRPTVSATCPATLSCGSGQGRPCVTGPARRLSAYDEPQLNLRGDVMTIAQCGLEERIATLEKQLGRTQRAAARSRGLVVLGAAAVMSIVTMAATRDQAAPQVIQAERFEVVDNEGRVVLVASAGEAGGQLDLWGANGQNVLRLWSNEHGGDLAMWNNQGKNVFAAFAGTDGGEMALWNSDGQRVYRAQANEHGGRIDLLDARHQVPVFTAASRENGGAIIVANTAGVDLFEASATEIGGRTVLANQAGQVVIRQLATQQGSGLLEVNDQTGRRRFAAGPSADGSVVRLYGSAAEPVVTGGASIEHAGGFLHVQNHKGVSVFTVAAEADGGGRLDLANELGGAVFSVDAIQDSGAVLAMMDSAGVKLFLVGTTPAGGLLNLMNPKGHVVVAAGASLDTLAGALTLRNRRGRQIVEAGAAENDDGLISVWDADGDARSTVSPP